MRLIDADVLLYNIRRDSKKAIDEGDKVGSFWLGYAAGLVIKQPTIQPIATDTNVGDTISRQATIDALDTAIEHYDGIAEECRKKADIERNDYMDMRDDAYEAQQLAQWLNELKYLREKIEQLTIKPEPTDEQVEEYCKKRCLHVVTDDYFRLAQPEPHEGHWIGKYPTTHICSECGWLIPDSKVKVFAYCPNCGARMKGERQK